MAKVAELLNSLHPLTKEHDAFLQNLLSESCDIPLEAEEAKSIEDAIITAINTKINKANTRSSGLKFLQQILPRISKETLLTYGTLWITKAVHTLESAQSNISELTTACKILAALVVTCKEIPDLHKQISTQNVKTFITLIGNMKLENRCGATYYLIAVLLHHYPEVCERFQDSIRKMIIPHVDSYQQNLITAGANCHALLIKATERSFKPPTKFANYTNWVYHQLLLCNSLHNIMNQLFSDILEFISADKRELEASDTLDLPEISEDNVLEYYNGLERRFINLCIYLSTMLRGCGQKHSVSPTDILQVLCRGLAISPFNLGKDDSVKSKILFFMLPKLHVSLLEILRALIEGFRQELMPFSYSILKLIQQTLDWTEKVSRDQTTLSLCKPFKNVRLSAYKTLTVWLSHTGSLSGVETVTKDLLSHILKEIKVVKNTVLLTVQKTNHLSKKSQKKLRDSQYENSPSLRNSTKDSRDSHVNADLCEEALVTLQNILFSGSCWLDDSFYEKIKDEIVPSLNDLYLEASESNVYKVKANCRLQLLKTLKALQLNSHPLTPPPTQFSIEIFNMALRDEDFSVVQEAKLGLAELEKIVHPSAPTLNFPIEPRDKNTDKEKESSELVNTNGFSQQRSMFELLDSVRSNDNSEQSKKRVSENIEITSSKLRKTERNESVSTVVNSDSEKSSALQQDSTNLEEINEEVSTRNIINKEGSLSMETTSDQSPENLESSKSSGNMETSDQSPENLESSKSSGNMETEIIKEPLTDNTENEREIEETLQSQDLGEEEKLLQLFVDQVQENY